MWQSTREDDDCSSRLNLTAQNFLNVAKYFQPNLNKKRESSCRSKSCCVCSRILPFFHVSPPHLFLFILHAILNEKIPATWVMQVRLIKSSHSFLVSSPFSQSRKKTKIKDVQDFFIVPSRVLIVEKKKEKKILTDDLWFSELNLTTSCRL